MRLLVWYTRADGTQAYFNRYWHEYTGIRCDDPAGTTWSSLLHPDDCQPTLDRWHASLRSGEPCDIECRLRRYDGAYRWFLVQVAPIRDEAGTISGWCATGTDIEPQKQALLERERWLSLAIDQPALGTFELDVETQRIQCSPRCRAIYGLPPDTAITSGVALRHMHPEDRARAAQAVRQALDGKGNGHYDLEYRCVWPDGSVRWIAVRGNVLFEQRAGVRQPVRLFGTIMDVTDRKQAEQAVRAHIQELEFLAHAGLRLLELRPGEDILTYIGEQVNSLVDDAIVIVSSFDAKEYRTTAHSFYGVEPDRVIAVLGRSPIGMSFFVTEKYRQMMLPAMLQEVPDGLYGLTFEQLPRDLCRHIEQQLGVQQVYAMPFAVREDLLGTIAILARSGQSVRQRHLIEAFISAAAVAVQRHRAERALQESEERFRTLADNIPQLAWMADAKGRIFWYNQRWFDFTGGRPGEMEERDWRQFQHPDHLQRVLTKIRRCLETGETWEDTFPLRRRDGSYRWFLSRAIPLRDDAGNVVRWFGTNTDVTEQREADQERDLLLAQLRASVAEANRNRAQLEAVFEAMQDGVVVFDMKGNAIFVNEAEATINGFSTVAEMERNLGFFAQLYEIEELDGRPLALDQWPVSRVLRGESFSDWELRGRRRDTGQQWTFSFSGASVRDEQGRQVLAVVITRDITERKDAEVALRRSEAALREADRRKNEFLGMLSHELRNPLAPIRNSLYILARAAPGSDQARRAQAIIDRQVSHLTRLVDDLLDVTRISRGKIQLQRAPLNLNDLVRRTIEDHRPVFAANGVGLDVRLPHRALWVEGDGVRLAQVVGNLLQNAAKFTERGGHVRVVLDEDRAAQRCVIRVKDTGVGISPELLARLFEPFMQADRTLDRSLGGLGLGLALVKGLVELHGGEVEARSAGAGKGAEFTVRLPLLTERAAQRRTLPAAGTHRSRRVLIIEDNVDAADSLREALRFGRHEVEVALSGREGIEKAQAFRPDVILCDIGLPGMDGYEVARAVRADPVLHGTYLVALSGYALPEDLDKARQAGFDRHLAKPSELGKLEEILAGAPHPE